MALTKWGFICRAPGTSRHNDATDKRTDVVGSPACVLLAVGVPSVGEGNLRLSPHIYNEPTDIDRALTALGP